MVSSERCQSVVNLLLQLCISMQITTTILCVTLHCTHSYSGQVQRSKYTVKNFNEILPSPLPPLSCSFPFSSLLPFSFLFLPNPLVPSPFLGDHTLKQLGDRGAVAVGRAYKLKLVGSGANSSPPNVYLRPDSTLGHGLKQEDLQPVVVLFVYMFAQRFSLTCLCLTVALFSDSCCFTDVLPPVELTCNTFV